MPYSIDIPNSTRLFYPDELRLLTTLRKKKEKELHEKGKYHYFLITAIIGVVCNYLAAVTTIGFLGFVFGSITVFAYTIVVFMPYELYKKRKKLISFIADLQTLIEKGTVTTYPLNTTRIALAEEHEDESALYIIEYDSGSVFHLWDYDYDLYKKFPCLDFEIYEDSFYKLIGRRIYPLSKRVDPTIVIDDKQKWAYMKKFGAPDHLQTEQIGFDELIEKYKNI